MKLGTSSLLIGLLSLVHVCLGKVIYAGVNEAGGEFNGGTLPGEFGVDYQFINRSHGQYFLDNGVNVFRNTFLLERMCPLEYDLGSKFNETYYREYQRAVDFITERSGYSSIDPHNYMRYNNASAQPNSGSVIGNTSDPNAATTAQFQAFWTELASPLRYNPNFIFGIMNEPHNMPTQLILADDQAAIDGIRSTGAQQLILAPGNGYTGAEDRTNVSATGIAPNSDVLTAIQDPSHNFAFDMHLHLDADFSGTHNACVSAGFGVQNIALATAWLEQNNYAAFLSEFGGGSNEVCFEAPDNLLDWLETHDNFIGWSYWAAGPKWGDFFLGVEPGEGPEFDATWPTVLRPHFESYQPIERFEISK